MMPGMGQVIFDKGVEQGIEQGIERGMKQGMERGIEQGIVMLVKDGYITPEIAGEKLNKSPDEVHKILNEYVASIRDK
ncbi:MAG: hypothetical protein J6N76_02595 [Lachnospiraceae bacterium]|nr:hypothetical protein [Lachnospiraceae bacterium]